MPELRARRDAAALEVLVLGAAVTAVAQAPSSGARPRLARRILLEAEPGSGVLGDDRAADAPAPRLVWIVEPLDGPAGAESVDGRQGLAVAAAVDGAVVASAVIDVHEGRAFSAHRGGGATEDGRRIRVAGSAERGRAAVVTEASASRRTDDASDDPCPALLMCRVARGSLDGYAGSGLAGSRPASLAGAHIAEEAGAVVELPCPENDDLVLVAAPFIFEPLRRTVAPGHADRRG